MQLLTMLSAQSRRLLGHAVIRNALLLYAVQFSGYILPLIALPYLSRVLSTEKFGLIAYAQAFMFYFLTLTDYGFNLTATRAVAVARGDLRKISEVFSAVMVAKLLLTVSGGILLVAVVFSVPTFRAHWELFFLSFLSVIGNALFPIWLYQGLQKMGSVALRDFAAKLVSLIGIFVLVHDDADYLWAAAAQGGGFLLAGMVGLVPLRWTMKIEFRPVGWQAVREQLVTGWPPFLSLALVAFGAVTNTLILGLYSSSAEVAYFSASNRVISVLRALVTPISTAVFPHTSQKADRSELEVIRFVRKYALPLSGPFIAGGVVLALSARWLIPFALGDRYQPAVPVLQVMAISPALLAVAQVYSMYYMLACGYYKVWTRIMIASAALNFVILAVTMSLMRGSIAVGLTAVLAEAFSVFCYWRFFHRRAREIEFGARQASTE